MGAGSVQSSAKTLPGLSIFDSDLPFSSDNVPLQRLQVARSDVSFPSMELDARRREHGLSGRSYSTSNLYTAGFNTIATGDTRYEDGEYSSSSRGPRASTKVAISTKSSISGRDRGEKTETWSLTKRYVTTLACTICLGTRGPGVHSRAHHTRESNVAVTARSLEIV